MKTDNVLKLLEIKSVRLTKQLEEEPVDPVVTLTTIGQLYTVDQLIAAIKGNLDFESLNYYTEKYYKGDETENGNC